ncbi:MAG: hypothetical protein HKL96_11525 [Phycisphaerales bacterium]|nr:hypothetical protein [Phycisphaerales bacterium]
MTDPGHIAQWWGPQGFSTRTSEMDVRVGGRWVHVMHGPDGVEYPNTITYTAVEAPQKLAFTNRGGRKGGDQIEFNSLWTLEEASPEQTCVTIRMTFASAGERDRVVREYGAMEGGQQTLERLDAWAADIAKERFRELIITRRYDASPAAVFNAWVTPAILREWWGPQGFSNPVCEVDPRVGGRWRIVMRSPDGREYPCGGIYREIVPDKRLMFTNNAEDNDGLVILQGMTVVTFTPDGGGTELTLRTQAVAMVTYAAAYLKGMQAGWSQSLDRLTGVVII